MPFDAERDGASEREAAAVVLNAKADNRRAWIGSEHRTRLRRLLARGHKLLAGGYSSCSTRRLGGGEGRSEAVCPFAFGQHI